MSLLKPIIDVDEIDELIVFGYIRLLQSLCQLAAIPPLIRHLCLLFYYETEYFIVEDISKGNMEIDKNNVKRITGYHGHAFGTMTIKLQNDKIQTHRWKFKINDCGKLFFGIIDKNKINQLSDWGCFAYKGFGYALRSYGDLYSANGQPGYDQYKIAHIDDGRFRAGDIIEMELNTLKAMLLYTIDNKTMTIQQISKNISFKLALFAEGTCDVELLSYIKTH